MLGTILIILLILVLMARSRAGRTVPAGAMDRRGSSAWCWSSCSFWPWPAAC